MKILIAYHSQTGNTEKIAGSIKEALDEEDVSLVKAQEVDPSSLGSYDLVFLGSGVYGNAPGKPLKSLMRKIEALPKHVATFYTHATWDMHQKAFNRIKKAIETKNSTIVGEFECSCENIGVPEAMQQKLLENLPEEKRKEAIARAKQLVGHPDKEDLKKASAFAKSVLQKVKG